MAMQSCNNAQACMSEAVTQLDATLSGSSIPAAHRETQHEAVREVMDVARGIKSVVLETGPEKEASEEFPRRVGGSWAHESSRVGRRIIWLEDQPEYIRHDLVVEKRKIGQIIGARGTILARLLKDTQCEIFVLDKEGHPPELSPEERIVVLVGTVEQVKSAMLETTTLLNNVDLGRRRHRTDTSCLDDSGQHVAGGEQVEHHVFDGQDTFHEQPSQQDLWVPGENWQAMSSYYHHAIPSPQQYMPVSASQSPHLPLFMPAVQHSSPEPFMPMCSASPYMVACQPHLAQYAAPYQPPSLQPYVGLYQQPLMQPHGSQWGPAQQSLPHYDQQPFYLQHSLQGPAPQPLPHYDQPFHLQHSLQGPAPQPLPSQSAYPHPQFQPAAAYPALAYQQSTHNTNSPMGPAPFQRKQQHTPGRRCTRA